MEAFTDAVGLRRAGFGFGMINSFQGQVQLILVMLQRATVFCTTIGEKAQEGDLLLFKPGDNPVIEQISSRQRILAVIEFDEGHFAVGINKGLLIDAANPFERADVVGVLRAQLARMFRLNLPFGFPLLFSLFQRFQLGFAQHHCLLFCQQFFQSGQSLLEGFQIVAQPD